MAGQGGQSEESAFWGPRLGFPQLVTDLDELEFSAFGPGRWLQRVLLFLRCMYIWGEQKIESHLH